jgi:hypothetical protein
MMDSRTAFASTYSAWNSLGIYYNKPYVKVKPDSSYLNRKAASIANVGKKALVALAVVIATVVTGIFNLFTLPYRFYQFKNAEELVASDMSLLSNAEKIQLRQEILASIEAKEAKHGFKLTAEEQEEYVRDVSAYYARSSEFYGPVALKWTEYLLETANVANKKLVFCARDGIVPYKIAIELMKKPNYQQKYPNLFDSTGQNPKLILAYLSRNLVEHSHTTQATRELFHDYLRQLNVKDEDKCIFVDIGFQGRQIANTRDMLSARQIEADFSYLLSHTDHAEGFIISVDDRRRQEQERFKQLPSIESIRYGGAGSNLATHWLEDTHQGNNDSPSELVLVNGKVYPNTLSPLDRKYVARKGSKEYFLRKWCQKAVIRSTEKYTVANINLNEAVSKLDDLLDKIVNGTRPLLVSHK